MYPHVIRLREPWSHFPIEDGERYERAFNCPTGLDDREQVWLVVEGLSQEADVSCNRQRLGYGKKVECDITAVLALRNVLQIDLPVAKSEDTVSPPGEVRLEIRLGPARRESPG
jgi:hypothetical protein